jgi:branched-chain amino acid transport system ATP-binding protein
VSTVLRLDGLHAGYGKATVVRDLDLHLEAGEIVALLGPNGAGKTTTLLTISGLLPRLAGRIEVLGAVLGREQPHEIAAAGVAHVPEDRSLFYGLTVAQNLRLGTRRGAERAADDALELFPTLRGCLHRRAGLLSGGEQQMLALARALASAPRLLMVDEMSLGLAPVVVERLVEALARVAREDGVGVLLVEQHVEVALALADRAYVLNHGRVVLQGPASELGRRADLLEAGYLGTALR